MTLRAVSVTVVLLVSVAGCGSGQKTSSTPDSPAATTTYRQAIPASSTHQWGETAVVVGDNGSDVKLTPVGILYDKGPYRGIDGPANGWFVAVVMRAEPTTQAETLQPFGHGFQWRGSQQTITGNQGKQAPWVAEVPVFSSDQPIQVGKPMVGVVTFDVPSKTGGELAWVNADNTVVSWSLPAAETGIGLERVKQRIKEFR